MIGATPPIQQALDEGLEWTFVRKEVVLAVPGIREFLSECGNASHGTEQRQTLIQTMLQCHSKGKRGANQVLGLRSVVSFFSAPGLWPTFHPTSTAIQIKQSPGEALRLPTSTESQTRRWCEHDLHPYPRLPSGKTTLLPDGKVDWRAVTNSVELLNPHFKGQVMDLCLFVEKWSGGAGGPKDAHYLRELDSWAKTQTRKVDVPSHMFKLLAQCDLTFAPEVTWQATAPPKDQTTAPHHHPTTEPPRNFPTLPQRPTSDFSRLDNSEVASAP